ncbi:TIGR01906 family membrane protein [Schnuerera ultunensis]|uniref:TIGR01906 family membrane protein n=1 Tax=Schnuerera ultunensis TaxID=45497 RepID=UPI00054D0408|nr:TIGR01906 family membrane protein [Schnuerera ultunensis]
MLMAILIIVLPFYLLLLSIEINTFNKNIYIDSYEKYNVTDTTGRSIEELEEITIVIFKYLREGLDGQVLKPYFNDKEIEHMEDVQLLFKGGFLLKNISLFLSLLAMILFIIYRKGKSLGNALFYGTFVWWGVFLLLFIASLIDFNRYFTYFHLIFFDNELWLLNPSTDLLIQMLPEEFFISIFIRIILFFLLTLAIIQIVGYILMKKGKDYNGGIVIKF